MNDFTWHTNALKGVRGPINADDPEPGFYENRWKDRQTGDVTRQPVAYWYDTNNGELRCHKNGRDVEELRAREMWPHASKRPITREGYDSALKGIWLDDAKGVSDAAALANDEDLTPAQKIIKEIEEAKKDLPNYLKIDSDDVAAKGQSLRSLFTTLAGKLDKEREALVRPHLDAQRDINAQYNPAINAAKADANTIKKALEQHETDKRVAQRAAEARQAELDAEAARNADWQAAAPVGSVPEPVAAPVRVVSNAPPPSTQIKGGSGRAASVSTYQHVLSIDIDKVFEQFKGDAHLMATLMELAQKAINAGIPVPGATTEERAKVR